jgi:hypothetical protein
MSVRTYIAANEILNRVAAEVGVSPISDPYASTDPIFVQMRYLLNTAGEELMQMYAWEALVRSHNVVTQDGDTGVYDLPDDFGYMINQTGWEQTQNVPLGGPLSAQEWTYLKGRDLASNTLYASFRIADGSFNIYPTPPPAGLDLTFEYVSTCWAESSEIPAVPQSEAKVGSDKVLYDKTLITRMVKVKYLEAAGFDSAKAQADLNQIFGLLTGSEKGADILNAGRPRSRFRYLDGYNMPDTGYSL